MEIGPVGRLISKSAMNYRYLKDLQAGNPVALLRLALHLPSILRLHWRLVRDRRVGLAPKLVLLTGVLYFLLPLDLIPEFPLGPLGWLDDLIAIGLASSIFMRLCPARVVQEHVELIDKGG